VWACRYPAIVALPIIGKIRKKSKVGSGGTATNLKQQGNRMNANVVDPTEKTLTIKPVPRGLFTAP
jgi:hypothetical protein